MTRTEFVEETHQYIDYILEEQNEYHNILKELFAQTHMICEKHNIEYYLIYGTLLGFIRDGGEILPWDADLDIAMPITEVQRFIKALDEELGDEYYYVSNYTTDRYYLAQMRIGKKGYDSELLHLDVFYMIGAPANTEDQEKMSYNVKRLFDVRRESLGNIVKQRFNINGRIMNCIVRTHRVLKGRIHSAKYLDRQFDIIANKYDYNKSEYVLMFDDGAMIVPKDIFMRKKVSLGYSDAYIPEKAEEFLKRAYGDYTNYPSMAEMFHELLSWYKWNSENNAN